MNYQVVQGGNKEQYNDHWVSLVFEVGEHAQWMPGGKYMELHVAGVSNCRWWMLCRSDCFETGSRPFHCWLSWPGPTKGELLCSMVHLLRPFLLNITPLPSSHLFTFPSLPYMFPYLAMTTYAVKASSHWLGVAALRSSNLWAYTSLLRTWIIYRINQQRIRIRTSRGSVRTCVSVVDDDENCGKNIKLSLFTVTFCVTNWSKLSLFICCAQLAVVSSVPHLTHFPSRTTVCKCLGDMSFLHHTFCRLSFTRIFIGYVYKLYKLRSVAHSLFRQLETLCDIIDLKYFCNIFTLLLISECNFCYWSQKSRFNTFSTSLFYASSSRLPNVVKSKK